jgi:hypothetical protein
MIRGAGEILGYEQSGEGESIGQWDISLNTPYRRLIDPIYNILYYI